MAEVQDANSVIEDSIEDLVRIPDPRNNMDSGPLFDPPRRFRALRDMCNHLTNAGLYRRDHSVAIGTAVGGCLAEIGRCPVGVFNLYDRRQGAQAASTSV